MNVPYSVETVLSEYISLFNEHYPGELEGLYIHGSIALQAYVDGSSDIDFIAVTGRRLTGEDTETLSFIHAELAKKYPKPEMDGVYVTWEDMGKINNDDTTCPYYNNGTLTVGPYFNFNPVTWWIFKEKGINIVGPNAVEFQIDIQPDQLLSYVLANMNSYWANRIQVIKNAKEQIMNLPQHLINEEIEWTVLGLLRQYYTLKGNDIISKTGAGEYGLLQLPEEWHSIIKEALNIRNKDASKLFESDEERVNAVIDFSEYLIVLCNDRAI